MNIEEWKKRYVITDDEFDFIAFMLKETGGKITEPENPPLDYKIVKYNS